jgi:hypothetical protein
MSWNKHILIISTYFIVLILKHSYQLFSDMTENIGSGQIQGYENTYDIVISTFLNILSSAFKVQSEWLN